MLKMALLGMPDNSTMRLLLDSIQENGITLDCITYWKPRWRDQVTRVMRKCRAIGVSACAERIFYALSSSHKSPENKSEVKEAPTFFVRSHASQECADIIAGRQIDVIILATDAIIPRRVFKSSRLGALNVHSGWVPQFRGLGALQHSLRSGLMPAVSIHFIDEGIDTGPVLVRQQFVVDSSLGLEEIERLYQVFRVRFFAQWLRNFVQVEGRVTPIDTFLEPSRLARGFPHKERVLLDQLLRSGKITL